MDGWMGGWAVRRTLTAMATVLTLVKWAMPSSALAWMADSTRGALADDRSPHSVHSHCSKGHEGRKPRRWLCGAVPPVGGVHVFE